MSDIGIDLGLSPARLLFARCFVATGNPLQAVKAAGYSTRGRSAYVIAWRLIHDAKVRAAIGVVALAMGLPEPDLSNLLISPPAAPQWGAEHKARIAELMAGIADVAAQRDAARAGRRAGIEKARQARMARRANLGLPVPASFWTGC